MALTPGTRLGPYEIVAPLGAGGMGEVYRAKDTTLGREAALKVLPPHFADDAERMARFEREARLLASLNHPHIASIYGAGADAGVRFLAMELVEGEELAAQIARGPIPVGEAVALARQIAEALEVAHEKGIIHRDLKPANVKITPEGSVKLLDFGLAKALEGEKPPTDSESALAATITTPMTAPQVILGTAAYMSPEQARGKAVDRRADIWAFGCVLYECLTGQRPFRGETVSYMLAKILEREPDFTKLPGDTPPAVRELLARCLVKDAKLRLRDIGDARIALDELLATRSSTGRFAVAEAPAAVASRRQAPLVPLAVAALAGLALGAGLLKLLAPAAPAVGPRCVSIAQPHEIKKSILSITADGRTEFAQGRLRDAPRAEAATTHIYARNLDRFDYAELTTLKGLEFAAPWLHDPRQLAVVMPLAPDSPQLRLLQAPVDGSAPPTSLTEFKDTYGGLVQLASGELIISEGPLAFVRIPPNGGPPSPSVRMDAGRPGVSRFEFTLECLPGERTLLVNVVAYDARGWHYSVGALDLGSGKVKVVVEDGGNAVFVPPGALVFSRGDAVLAVPFDLGRLEARGTPVAVWSGLTSPYTFSPGGFQITHDGSLFYRPGVGGSERQLALLDAAGVVTPWSGEKRTLDGLLEPSPDGRRFACQIASARGIDEIWVSEVDRPDLHRLGTDPNADCTSPRWSADGRRLVYWRNSGDDRDGLYVQDAEGGTAERISRREAPNVDYYGATWLADGATLLLARRVNGAGRLALLRPGGAQGDTTRLTNLLPGEAHSDQPRISPDGRLVVYTSDEAGEVQSCVAELRPGGGLGRPVPVRLAIGGAPRWGADGRTLFIEDSHHRLMRVGVTLAPELSVTTPVEVRDLDQAGVAAGYWTPLPDGRFLVGLKNASDGEATTYNLVLNWTAELQRRMKGSR